VRHAAAQGGDVVVVFLHFADTGGNTGQGLKGTCAHAVDADALRAKIVGEVSDGRIECGLADPHDVVSGDAFFAAEVSHRQDRRVGFEHAASGIGHRDQAIDTHVHGQFEACSAGLDGISRQVVSIGKRDGVEQKVDLSEVLGSRVHEVLDLLVVLNIQGS